MEFAIIRWFSLTREGILDCTEGWYAPAILYKSINVIVIKKIRETLFIRKEKIRITNAVKKSNITIIFLLFILSATIPPIGENKIAGRKAQAVTIP
jgi:hypothetical protein